jgi:CDP-glycerol glycerophosphotransferase (TagB/SpsB family)
MDKPVVFYQFDQKDFFSKHYTSSGEPYPFGDIFMDEESYVDEIEATVKRGFSIKEKYQKDVENFYSFRDKKNCERNYNLIVGGEK